MQATVTPGVAVTDNGRNMGGIVSVYTAAILSRLQISEA